ncbi:hypothetical protein SAMN05216226_11575 [Halovenus aranensis]|uniref:Uncharacterized protein n=1 Tax=Halovenus aranensis TaxID=890420 RepID=A0A1G8YNX8_9EURY|nr:hypothetical protein SAMN05216226_11575 [Halovenus aranensis]
MAANEHHAEVGEWHGSGSQPKAGQLFSRQRITAISEREG